MFIPYTRTMFRNYTVYDLYPDLMRYRPVFAKPPVSFFMYAPDRSISISYILDEIVKNEQHKTLRPAEYIPENTNTTTPLPYASDETTYMIDVAQWTQNALLEFLANRVSLVNVLDVFSGGAGVATHNLYILLNIQELSKDALHILSTHIEKNTHSSRFWMVSRRDVPKMRGLLTTVRVSTPPRAVFKRLVADISRIPFECVVDKIVEICDGDYHRAVFISDIFKCGEYAVLNRCEFHDEFARILRSNDLQAIRDICYDLLEKASLTDILYDFLEYVRGSVPTVYHDVVRSVSELQACERNVSKNIYLLETVFYEYRSALETATSEGQTGVFCGVP